MCASFLASFMRGCKDYTDIMNILMVYRKSIRKGERDMLEHDSIWFWVFLTLSSSIFSSSSSSSSSYKKLVYTVYQTNTTSHRFIKNFLDKQKSFPCLLSFCWLILLLPRLRSFLSFIKFVTRSTTSHKSSFKVFTREKLSFFSLICTRWRRRRRNLHKVYC